jgi:arsenate reductase (thioredoxin)
MAEGFARAYGSDVVEAFSAGLAAANVIAQETRKVMGEKGIDLGEQFPKDVRLVRPALMDIVVNISGFPLPEGEWKDVREWAIPDPIGESEKFHREIRDQVEVKVMELLLGLRGREPVSPVQPAQRPSTGSRVRFGRSRH